MHNNALTNFAQRSGLRSGFTVIELIVVVVIIGVLLTLSASVGFKVVEKQKITTTTGVLSSLDRILEEVITEEGAVPPYNPVAANLSSPPGGGSIGQYYEAPGQLVTIGGIPNRTEFYNTFSHSRHPDVSVFLQQAASIGQSDAILGNIGDRFLVPTPTSIDTDVTPSVLDVWGDVDAWVSSGASAGSDAANEWTVMNSEAQLIFYVHPSNTLAQDLYGKCLNGRAYFMSAGPDLEYGTTSQFTADGMQNPQAEDLDDLTGDDTLGDRAVSALEDNIYSYTLGAPPNDKDFDEVTR